MVALNWREADRGKLADEAGEIAEMMGRSRVRHAGLARHRAQGQPGASRLGLALGPAEVGPALRLGYLDQPLGEFLRIAMNPVARHGGEPVDFTIGNGGAGLLLIGGDFRSDLVVSSATRFVFVRPRARGPSFQAQGPGG
jgi:hypothetical protein